MNEELDNLLADWAKRNSPGEDRLAELSQRISREALRQSRVQPRTEPARVLWGARLAWFAAGAVVGILVCAACAFWLLGARGTPPDAAAALAFADISADQLRVDRRLFDEMENLFSDRLRWVAESDGDVGVGVEAIHGGVGAESTPAHVRLAVVSRRAGDVAWTPVWRSDVLLRSEEVVEVAPGGDPRSRVALWVYPLSDGRITVDLSLHLAGALCVQVDVDEVYAPGRPAEVLSVRSGDAEYRVLQTVSLL